MLRKAFGRLDGRAAAEERIPMFAAPRCSLLSAPTASVVTPYPRRKFSGWQSPFAVSIIVPSPHSCLPDGSQRNQSKVLHPATNYLRTLLELKRRCGLVSPIFLLWTRCNYFRQEGFSATPQLKCVEMPQCYFLLDSARPMLTPPPFWLLTKNIGPKIVPTETFYHAVFLYFLERTGWGRENRRTTPYFHFKAAYRSSRVSQGSF